jgi:hypothetical protein
MTDLMFRAGNDRTMPLRSTAKTRWGKATTQSLYCLFVHKKRSVLMHPVTFLTELKLATAGKLIVRSLHKQRPVLKFGFNGRNSYVYSSSFLRF